ncbi:MAG: hypothetical protein PF692_11570 [Kiritimatiellae bacterium]|jgi:hypothetical protein|nr:hypothetical protein [Kiritimatiellia bacterium]
MKKIFVVGFVLVLVCQMFAVVVDVPQMPVSAFVDNEASVSAVIPEVFDKQSKTFKFYLTFNATLSNNVEIAFGQAVPGDISGNTPNLTHEETDLIVGWDCGKWFLRPKGLKEFYYSPVTNFVAGERTLSGFLRVDPENNLYSMDFKDGGVSFAFDGVAVSNFVEWLKPTEWDLLKVVTRGDNTEAENIKVSFSGDKTVIIVQ